MQKGLPPPITGYSLPNHSISLWNVFFAVSTLCLLTPVTLFELTPAFDFLNNIYRPAAARTPLPPKGPINWHSCDSSDDRFECGRVKVPLNYLNKSDSRTVDLAVGRYLARKSKRLGSIFVNPGSGPGGSGLSFLYRAGPQISQVLDGAYDIVSWDPRGVNGSLPNALCHPSKLAQDIYNIEHSATIEFSNLTTTPNVPPSADISVLTHQIRTLWAKSSLYATLCNTYSIPSSASDPEFENGFDLLSYYGTSFVVRDLEYLSSVIEGPDSPVNYAGFSYGTEIGAVFVGMFPNRVGKVWIDGVVDPVVWAEEPEYKFNIVDLVDTEKALKDFVRKCVDAGPERCALASNSTKSAAVLRNKILGLIEGLYYRPLPVPHARSPGLLRSGHIRDALFVSMYRPRSWPGLARDLVAVLEGDGAPILNSQSATLDTSSPPDSSSPILQAVVCADGPPVHHLLESARQKDGKKGEEEFMEKVVGELVHIAERVFVETSEVFAGVEVSPACFHWRLNPPERFVGPWNRTLAGPILIVGNTADPITPLSNAKAVNELLKNDSRLVIQDGSGHCSLAQVSLCTSKIVREYFLEGKLPENGKVCNVTEVLFPPKSNITTVALSYSGAAAGSDGEVVQQWETGELKIMSEDDLKLLEAMKGVGEAIEWEWNAKHLRKIRRHV